MLKRRFLAMVIFFLMTTAAFTPAAFFAGLARGQAKAAQPDAALFQNEPEARRNALNARRRYGIATICGGDYGRGVMRDPISQVFCHPFFTARRASGSGVRAVSAPSRKTRPLSAAVISSVAGDSAKSPLIGDPLFVALAPDGGALSNLWAAPTVPPGAGFPGSLAVGYVPAPPGGDAGLFYPITNPSDPVMEPTPPPIVTPLPTALLFFASGGAGLFAAAGRKSKAARGFQRLWILSRR